MKIKILIILFFMICLFPFGVQAQSVNIRFAHLTEEGDRACLEKVKSCLDLLKVKYYVALGNHEAKWSDLSVPHYAKYLAINASTLSTRAFKDVKINIKF